MARLFLAAAFALLGSSAAAQSWRVPVDPPPQPPPARATAPAQAAPAGQAQPAQPSGSNGKAIDQAKSLGKRGLQKVAPKLGKAEKLVNKQGDRIVDQAVDLAAQKGGFGVKK